MNLIYKVENIPLNRCADMIETDNHKLMSKYIMPNKYLKKKYDEFRLEFSAFLFDADVYEFLDDEWSKTLYYHKASTVLPLLFLGLKHCNDERYIDYYEKFYGKFPGVEQALHIINAAISTLNNRIAELNEKNKDEKQQESEKFSLWKLIEGVEFLIERPIDLNVKLSVFKIYLKRAKSKSK
jgi:hypothetical protein